MFYGEDIDYESRCKHYYGVNDVVALKCTFCQKYYACYKCHDRLENHTFVPTDYLEDYPVLCGSCHGLLSFEAYQLGYCCYCAHEFNPKCKNHEQYYFKRS